MKKRIIIAITLVLGLLTIGCSNNLTDPALKGFYQSEMKNGYIVQYSFSDEDKTYAAYINSIEIDKGTYEDLGNHKYKLIGEIEGLEVELKSDDTFNLNIKNLSEKINENEPIIMENKDKVPTYFESEYSDEDDGFTKQREEIKELLK